MKFSFCTACKGRTHHLKLSLLNNLKSCSKILDRVEFCILDYDSEDGLEEWMKERFREEISSGLIRYGKVRNLPLFKMAYSKNLSHTLSAGDFIFNTDADCLLTDEYPVKLYESVLEMDLNRIAVRDDCRVQGWLGLSKKNFTAMNGYDEGFEVWGSDDVDLYSRLRLKADVKNFD